MKMTSRHVRIALKRRKEWMQPKNELQIDSTLRFIQPINYRAESRIGNL